MGAGDGAQLGEHLRVGAPVDLGGEAQLEGVQPERLEPAGVGRRERRRAHVGERRAAPEAERAAQLPDRGLRVAGAHRPPPAVDEGGEQVDVDQLAVHGQPVAGRAGHQDGVLPVPRRSGAGTGGAQCPTQPGDLRLQRVRGPGR
jgi:hypothetical protein